MVTILLKVLFNEITPIVGGVIKFFDHQGVTKTIATMLSEIHDPPVPKKMMAPCYTLYSCHIVFSYPHKTVQNNILVIDHVDHHIKSVLIKCLIQRNGKTENSQQCFVFYLKFIDFLVF